MSDLAQVSCMLVTVATLAHVVIFHPVRNFPPIMLAHLAFMIFTILLKAMDKYEALITQRHTLKMRRDALCILVMLTLNKETTESVTTFIHSNGDKDMADILEALRVVLETVPDIKMPETNTPCDTNNTPYTGGKE